MGKAVPFGHWSYHRFSSVFTLILKLNICPSIINPDWNKEFEVANKTLKKKVPAKPAKSVLAAPVVDSANKFWFAGLGALSVAQQEGEKLIDQGGKLFDKLVAEGARLEKKSIDVAETAVDDIKSEIEEKFEDVRREASENWDNLLKLN